MGAGRKSRPARLGVSPDEEYDRALGDDEVERAAALEPEAVAGPLRQVDLELEDAERRDPVDAPVDAGLGVLGAAGGERAVGDDASVTVLDRERRAGVNVVERTGAGALDALGADVLVPDDEPDAGLDVGAGAHYAADVMESALGAVAQLPGTTEEELRAGLADLGGFPRHPGAGLGWVVHKSTALR